MKKDYSLIQSTWKDELVKHSADYASLAHVTISEENRYLLKVIGLPLIFNTMDWSFLPFTYFPEIQVTNKGFYLLGDVGFGTTGTSLLGLDKEQENVYVIWIHGKDDVDCKFMNQSLYQYLMCLAHYTNFIKTEYPLPSSEVNKQVQGDYQILVDNMTKVDANAMERTNYWGEVMDRLTVSGYGDYLNETNYDSSPLSPEAQRRLENGEEFPF